MVSLNWDPSILSILITGFIIIVGVLLIKTSYKTKMPGVVPLLLFGIIIGPVTGLFDPFKYEGAIQAIVTLALIVVLFDAGYGISWAELRKGLAGALGLTVLSAFLTVLGVYFFATHVLKLALEYVLLLAAVGISTDLTIVAPILANIKLKKKTSLVIELESALNSVVAAIVAIIAISMINVEGFLLSDIITTSIYNIFVGISAGLIFGYLIVMIIGKLNLETKPYIISIGAVLVVFALTEFIGASGIIAALLIGMVFRNSKEGLPRIIKSYSNDLELLLVIFIYVLMGTLMNFEALKENWLLCIVFIGILLTARFASVAIFSIKQKGQAWLMFFASPRGIVTAVLVLSYASAFADKASFVLSMTFLLILVSTVLSAFTPKAAEMIPSSKVKS